MLSSEGLSAAIVSSGPQLAYLLGATMPSHERLTALVVSASSEATGQGMKLVSPSVDRATLAHTAAASLGIHVVSWNDGEDPYQLCLHAIASAHGATLPGAARIAVAPDTPAMHLLRFQRELPDASFELMNEALAELFMAKDEWERQALRQAAEAIDRVHSEVPTLLAPGRTEAQVYKELVERIGQEHASVDFAIVGSAGNGANPHHEYSDRTLELGDVVVVDLGGTTDLGYHSDCTRTYVVGGPSHASARVTAAYDALVQAHAAACDAVRPGVTAASVDKAARSVLEAAGYGEYFVHRTGHGIGLAIHEEPFIVGGNDVPLCEGMVFSIEPGIYVPGDFGMRLEDIVTVTASGYEPLNRGPRALR